MRDHIRRVYFRPFTAGHGPRFILDVYDTGRTDGMGKCILAYILKQTDGRTMEILFDGADFHCSPLHAIDSDGAIVALMGFLTLRPGDTDREYFEAYTERQLHYCENYAESLAYEVTRRFEKED